MQENKHLYCPEGHVIQHSSVQPLTKLFDWKHLGVWMKKDCLWLYMDENSMSDKYGNIEMVVFHDRLTEWKYPTKRAVLCPDKQSEAWKEGRHSKA